MSAYAAIHTGLKQLGIDADDARDLYERQTGKRSLREMTPKDHEAVIGELRRLGFKSASKGRRKALTGRYAKKLQALWISAWNLGVVRDREDHALLAFVKRQTGLDHVRFLHDAADARRAIEAIKGWMAREGGVEWKKSPHIWLDSSDSAKVAWAQFRMIVPGATVIGNARMFGDMCTGIVSREILSLQQLTPAEWRLVMNALGARIRRAKEAA